MAKTNQCRLTIPALISPGLSTHPGVAPSYSTADGRARFLQSDLARLHRCAARLIAPVARRDIPLSCKNAFANGRPFEETSPPMGFMVGCCTKSTNIQYRGVETSPGWYSSSIKHDQQESKSGRASRSCSRQVLSSGSAASAWVFDPPTGIRVLRFLSSFRYMGLDPGKGQPTPSNTSPAVHPQDREVMTLLRSECSRTVAWIRCDQAPSWPRRSSTMFKSWHPHFSPSAVNSALGIQHATEHEVLTQELKFQQSPVWPKHNAWSSTWQLGFQTYRRL